MFCVRCGKSLEPGEVHCPNCGEKMDKLTEYGKLSIHPNVQAEETEQIPFSPESPEVIQEEEVPVSEEKEKKKTKIKKRIPVLGIVGLVLIGVLLVEGIVLGIGIQQNKAAIQKIYEQQEVLESKLQEADPSLPSQIYDLVTNINNYVESLKAAQSEETAGEETLEDGEAVEEPAVEEQARDEYADGLESESVQESNGIAVDKSERARETLAEEN
ncbi:MAG: zinc ribbon domain-containing protein [Lachnospiraceae bacterium]|nr:zinc ribbon domain-containing protein [Lachnospiraceae bacterium]MDD3616651.1 zinc ribbon domain-containing protein [Lachnospiraceae bacterium]